MKHIFVQDRFYITMGVIIMIMALSIVWAPLMTVSLIALALLLLYVIYEIWVLRGIREELQIDRPLSQRYALGDEQEIAYELISESSQPIRLRIIDELPYQLQVRDMQLELKMEPYDRQQMSYTIRPTRRGEYRFGQVHLFIERVMWSMVQLRVSHDLSGSVAVVPSFIQMKKFDLEVFGRSPLSQGVRKVRRLGQNDEFEHIKHYTAGDDVKMINWKASARRNELMVNQYQDTQSQSIYAIIDKGRTMKMPFDGLTLLDYAINSALVLSNIVLKKYDRMGLLTLGQEVDTMIKDHNSGSQLMRISDALYAQQTDYGETDMEYLYYLIRQRVSRRSLLFLYTNFEHRYDMRRALPYLRQLSRLHVLVVILFTNRELMELGSSSTTEYNDIYRSTLAMNMVVEKEKIAQELMAHGIKVITTLPEELNIHVINKYLELKARRVR